MILLIILIPTHNRSRDSVVLDFFQHILNLSLYHDTSRDTVSCQASATHSETLYRSARYEYKKLVETLSIKLHFTR